MMVNIIGAEFPRYPVHVGMNLRDYFAIRAMEGMYAGRSGAPLQEKFFDEDARLAYAAADAMLARREKKT